MAILVTGGGSDLGRAVAGAFHRDGHAITLLGATGDDLGYEGLGAATPSVAEEVAAMALFLTSPAARHISGRMMHVSQETPTHFG